jgi:hypothetical protein
VQSGRYVRVGACKNDPVESRPLTALVEAHRASVQRFSSFPCLGHRPVISGVALPYTFITYAEAAKQVSWIGSAYASLGLSAKDKIGVMGPNSPEWMLSIQVREARKADSSHSMNASTCTYVKTLPSDHFTGNE